MLHDRDEDESRMEAERIVLKRIYKGVPEYFVKWKGYPESQNTWEQAKTLKAYPDLIEDYEKRARVLEAKQQTAKFEHASMGKSKDSEKDPESKPSLMTRVKRMLATIQKQGTESVPQSSRPQELAGRSQPGSLRREVLGSNLHLNLNLNSNSNSNPNSNPNPNPNPNQNPNSDSKGKPLAKEGAGKDPPEKKREESKTKNTLEKPAGKGKQKVDQDVRPKRVLGVNKLEDGSYEYAIECERPNGVPIIYCAASKDVVRGVPALIVHFLESHIDLNPVTQSPTPVVAEDNKKVESLPSLSVPNSAPVTIAPPTPAEELIDILPTTANLPTVIPLPPPTSAPGTVTLFSPPSTSLSTLLTVPMQIDSQPIALIPPPTPEAARMQTKIVEMDQKLPPVVVPSQSQSQPEVKSRPTETVAVGGGIVQLSNFIVPTIIPGPKPQGLPLLFRATDSGTPSNTVPQIPAALPTVTLLNPVISPVSLEPPIATVTTEMISHPVAKSS